MKKHKQILKNFSEKMDKLLSGTKKEKEIALKKLQEIKTNE